MTERQTLRFTLIQKLYAIPPECRPFEVLLNGVRVFETHEPYPEQGLPTSVGKYRIIFEAPISSSDELQAFSSEISEAAEDLDHSWIYACGAPLHPVGIGISFGTTPVGWQSNENEVRDYLLKNCRKPVALVNVGPRRHWISMPC